MALTAGAGSTLSFYAKSQSASGTLNVWIIDWTSSAVACDADAVTSTESQINKDLTGFGGDTVSVGFGNGSGNTWVSIVTVSSASNAGASGYLGTFSGSGSMWVWDTANSRMSFDALTGHNALGSLRGISSQQARTVSSMANASSTMWYQYVNTSGTAYVYIAVGDFTVGNSWTTCVSGNYTLSGWGGFWCDLSGLGSHDVMWGVAIQNSAGYTWLDDVCPNGNCSLYNATPTPTATTGPATSTPNYFPYGAGTPIPVNATITFPTMDWSQFPTSYPVPSPLYGLNTPQPVVVNGGSPIPVYFETPQSVIVTNTVVVKVDDSTPVRVQFAANNFTPSAGGAIQSYGDPAVGSSVPGGGYNVGSDFSTSSVPQFGVDTSHPFSMDNLVNLDVQQYHGSFCLPSLLNLVGENMCYDLTVDYINGAYVFGTDLSPWFLALAGALIFYGVVRQIQK